MQACILFRCKFLACEDHYWQVLHLGIFAEVFEDVEAAHIRQPQVEHDAVERFLPYQFERFASGGRDNDINILVPQQLSNAELLSRIVFHN